MHKKGESYLGIERKQQTALSILVSALIVLIPIFLLFSFYVYLYAPEYKLEIGLGIGEASVSEDRERIYISLDPQIDQENIKRIKFSLVDKRGKDHFFEFEGGGREVSVPYQRSIFNWVTGADFKGVYDYVIKSSEVGLKDFNDINKIEAFFEYNENILGTKSPKLFLSKFTRKYFVIQ